jgi:hypothetical protein
LPVHEAEPATAWAPCKYGRIFGGKCGQLAVAPCGKSH